MPVAPGARGPLGVRPRCGTLWNTFWTRGLCPGCRKQWGITQCLACKAFSPHRRWYHTPAPDKARRRRRREVDTVV
jgi:hypothetical protein